MCHVYDVCYFLNGLQQNKFQRAVGLEEQDKSSDIEQQPPFGDRKISNIQPQNRGEKKSQNELKRKLSTYR